MPLADETPLHVHPKAEETYRVLQGQLEINVNERWYLLHQGEELTVPAGIPHTFRNPTDNITKVYNVHTPAMHFDGYFEDLYKVITKLAGSGKQKLTMNLTSVVYLAMLMKKYPEEIISVNPPNFIVSILNFFGRIKRLEI